VSIPLSFLLLFTFVLVVGTITFFLAPIITKIFGWQYSYTVVLRYIALGAPILLIVDTTCSRFSPTRPFATLSTVLLAVILAIVCTSHFRKIWREERRAKRGKSDEV
jgi:predicted transcriptional regulator